MITYSIFGKRSWHAVTVRCKGNMEV